MPGLSLATIGRHVTAGQVDKVRDALPKDIQGPLARNYGRYRVRSLTWRTHIDARLLQHGRPPYTKAVGSRAEAPVQQLRQSPREHLERLHGTAELNTAHRSGLTTYRRGRILRPNLSLSKDRSSHTTPWGNCRCKISCSS
jgi:hypothetical protein